MYLFIYICSNNDAEKGKLPVLFHGKSQFMTTGRMVRLFSENVKVSLEMGIESFFSIPLQ